MERLPPISNDSIRLLTLLPGEFGDPLHCTIQAVSLASRAKYEALSYVWGQVGEDVVSVNGVSVKITPNLFAALQRLRNQQDVRVLWIDQLCIDQDNDAEKETQVGFMRDVYRGCHQCIIWMNDITEGDTDLTVADARALFGCFSVIAENRRMSKNRLQEKLDLIQPSSVEGVLRALRAVSPFGGSSWWDRIWTVQEALLPQRPIVQLGPVSMSWADIERFLDATRENWVSSTLRQVLASRPSNPFRDIAPKILSNMGGIFSHFRGLRRTRLHPDNLDIYRRWRFRHAKVPHDNIYALVGLFEGNPFPRVPSCSYDLPLNDLFMKVTLDQILSAKNLKPMIGRRHQNVTPDLPSWVFDMLQPIGFGSRTESWYRHLERYERFNACGRRGLSIAISPDEKEIVLKGILADRIQHVSDSKLFEVREPTLLECLETLREWKSFAEDVLSVGGSSRYVGDGSWSQAFARTAIGDLMVEDKYEPRRAKAEDWANADRFIKGEECHDQQLLFSIQHMLHYRAFFVTEKGYIGVGPLNTKPGCNVWLIRGGHTPFIFSAVDGDASSGNTGTDSHTCSFLGEAYVDGMMSGEWYSKEEHREQSVRLR